MNKPMTQEEKELLIKELCARASYGVKVKLESKPRKIIGVVGDNIIVNGMVDGKKTWDEYNIEEFKIKPYLRSLSTMTEAEKDEVKEICADYLDEWENAETVVDRWKLDAKTSYLRSVFYNSHNLDWNGLIEKGLALEAPEDMYDTKTE
jgi:hypothetical protein